VRLDFSKVILPSRSVRRALQELKVQPSLFGTPQLRVERETRHLTEMLKRVKHAIT
jgi:hypothetical protein